MTTPWPAWQRVADLPPSQTSLQLLEQSRRLQKWPLARLVSLFESNHPEARQQRHSLLHHLQQHPAEREALIIGLTGTPGAGKSSVLSVLSEALLSRNASATIAILAVDPSSHQSGGAILGDRTRMRTGGVESRLYFRSQASQLELGGISQNTFHVTRILRHFFDYIFIETVGIGQSEIEIQYLCDHNMLVMQPLAGDQIQFMKCGIMEIPDSFIVNKCDEQMLARQSYHLLKTSLRQANLVLADEDGHGVSEKPIFLTSALKRIGIDSLAAHCETLAGSEKARVPFATKQQFFIKKWLMQRYGQLGMAAWHTLDTVPDTADRSFEAWQDALEQHVRPIILQALKD